MAVFKNDNHLERAIEACLQVKAQIEKLPELSDHYSYKPKVSIGINCGEMISGNIGSVSLKRLDYTVIGDTVNTAQRLQSSATPNQIVISENSYNKISESFSCRKVGSVSLKNKTKPMVLYEVLEKVTVPST
jgi:class 3 adenylate cyclase